MIPDRSHGSARIYGWRDFDPEVVEGLVENDPRFVNRRQNGWIACPLSGHYDDRLGWQEDNYRKGSEPSGDPAVRFRAAPTYVLERALDNFIAGEDLIVQAIDGHWGNRAATGRLGNENSEDALTWNVFRSLQEAGCLGVAARVLADAEAPAEPELFFWGQRLSLTGGRTVDGARGAPRRARARTGAAGRAGRLPPPRGLGLGADRSHVRQWHRSV